MARTDEFRLGIPSDFAGVKALLERRLHDLKIRRHIEVPGREEVVMPDVQDFLVAVHAGFVGRFFQGYVGQNRITNRLKCLRDQ